METPSGAPSKEKAELSGNLGVADIVFSVLAFAAPLLVVVGLMPAMIGFAGQGVVAGFAATTLILVLFSVGYTNITRHVENPGGFYAFITAGLGKPAGLGGAFIAITGYLLLLLSTWVAFGVFGRQLITDVLHGPDIPWYVLSIAAALAGGTLSFFRIELSAKTLVVALILEIAIVIVFDVFVFADGGSDGIATGPFTWAGATEGSFGLAVLYAVLCFIGFESSTLYREEAKDPEKTIPRATYVGVVAIGLFYMVAAWAMITGLGESGVAGAKTADVTTLFQDLATTYVGNLIPDLVTVLVVTSTFACLLASHNAASRYLYSLGRDGVIRREFGKAHPRHRSPYFASATLTVLEVVATFVIAAATGFSRAGTDAFTVYIRMNGLGAFTVLTLMCIVSFAIIWYFKAHPGLRDGRSWHTVIAPVLGLCGLVAIFVLAIQNLSGLIGASTTVSMVLTLVLPLVFVGGFAHAKRLRSRNVGVYNRIGRQ